MVFYISIIKVYLLFMYINLVHSATVFALSVAMLWFNCYQTEEYIHSFLYRSWDVYQDMEYIISLHHPISISVLFSVGHFGCTPQASSLYLPDSNLQIRVGF